MAMVGIIFLYIAIVAAGIVVNLLLAFAVNNDCKALAIKNRGIWSVLTFFIPLVAILYLILRNSLEKESPKYCPSCGATSPPNSYACLNCGNAMLQDFTVTGYQEYKRKARNDIIAAVVIFVLSIIIAIAGFVGVVAKYVVEEGKDFGNSIEEFGEQFGNNFDFDNDFENDFGFDADGNQNGESGEEGTEESTTENPLDEFNNFGN